MGKGKWTRWGRNSCEGWSLDVGFALRGQAVRRHDRSWHASMNATDLGEWKTREKAMQAVETEITRQVSLILEDWANWQRALATSDSQPGKTGRTPGPTDTP